MAIFVSNLVIEQGFDFDATFELGDVTATPLNLLFKHSAQIRNLH